MNAVYSFLSYASKKTEDQFVSFVSRELHGAETTNFLSTNWQKDFPLVKWTTKDIFFTDVAIKIAVSVK